MENKDNAPFVEVEPIENTTSVTAIRQYPEDESQPVRQTPGLENPIFDNLTEQQRERDKHTTVLYMQYVEAHNDKQKFLKSAKENLTCCCIVWVTILILTCVVLSVTLFIGTDRTTSDIVALISSLIPLITAIIGILNIIIKYVFPEYEDQNITEIVKQIPTNDLENKQQNIGVGAPSQSKEKFFI